MKLSQATASGNIKCSLCSNIVLARELFWRVVNDSGDDVLWLCTDHFPLNTVGFDVEPATEQKPITIVQAKFLDVEREIIPALVADWNAIYGITAEEFEELVFNRILAMGHQAFRAGRANRRDGGIDIIFWTLGSVPALWAVQVKHHRSPEKHTGPDVVREFAGAISKDGFNGGMVVTNTSFTEDANWFVTNKGPLIQLRDGEHLQKWIEGDFTPIGWNFLTRTIELCPGLSVHVPQFI